VTNCMRPLLLLATVALLAQEGGDPKPVAVSPNDQIKHLLLIDRIRVIEITILRLQAEQQAKMDEYTRYINAKRLEYKVGDTFEIDIHSGTWVDRNPKLVTK